MRFVSHTIMVVLGLSSGTILAFLTDRVIIMRQAISGVLRGGKGKSYGWCNEGECSKSRHRYRDAETEALGKSDQHALEPRSFAPETSVVGGRA